MISHKTTIINKLGLHARAASVFVKEAQQFSADIGVVKGEKRANGKSIMSMLMLEGSQGTELILEISGEDEHEAMAAILELINDRFGEAE